MKRKTENYYLCNKQDVRIVVFKVMFTSLDFIITSAKVLKEDLLPEFLDREDLCTSLYIYLRQLSYEEVRDIPMGPKRDRYIADTLQLGNKILASGRLTGMEYLIALVKHHFRDEGNGLYITIKEPTTISFFGNRYGWNRLFIETPVTWENA